MLLWPGKADEDGDTSLLKVFPLVLYIFVKAMQRINNQFEDTKPASLGPATWVVLGGFIAQIISIVFLCWGLPPRRGARPVVPEYEQELSRTPSRKSAPSIAGSSTKSTRGLVVDDYYSNNKYQHEKNQQKAHHQQQGSWRPASYTYNDRDMGLVVEQPQYAGEYAPGALYELDTTGHPVEPLNYIRHDRRSQTPEPVGQSSLVSESLSRTGSRARSQRSRRPKGGNGARQEGW